MAQIVKNPPAMQETQINLWIRKIPWGRELLPTLVFLPGESHGQRSLTGYHEEQRVRHDWAAKRACAHTHNYPGSLPPWPLTSLSLRCTSPLRLLLSLHPFPGIFHPMPSTEPTHSQSFSLHHSLLEGPNYYLLSLPISIASFYPLGQLYHW